ncbi:ABC transporter substrate-binding protein [Cohnella silvisoli]|uniref:ABC transporter substrate-binding protein n=1 Tax=Cohnella silvisoli TaxID=2873699 RepID=A0ABV1KLG9_9BACL|nr:ABC transporter substrate-binding protein [Cohnella silvisoli]MCD9020829.1 ABC transporter substrate-binding protein [Cohnella silvisoli]
MIRTMSKTRKPWIAALALLLLVSTLLAACNNKGKSDEEVTLTFWNGFTGPDRPAYEAMVNEFMKAHPKIKIEMDIQPWDTLLAKLPTSLVSGKGPDIAAFNASLIPQYAKAGNILPLEDLYSSKDIDQSVLPPSLVKQMQFDGKFFGAPANFATLMMYYNKDLFKAAGLDPEKPPATWDEWKDAILKTTKSEGSDKQYGLVIGDHATIPNWPILIWGGGGDITSADGKSSLLADSKTIAAVKFWSDLVINDGISPVNLTGAEADKLFLSSKAAMSVTGPWMTPGFTAAGLNYAVAPIPVGPGGPVTLADSVALVGGKNTKHKEAVFEFMKFWNSKEQQITLSVQSGFPPARTDLANDPGLKKNAFAAQFATVANDARFYLGGQEQASKIDNDLFIPAIQTITNKKGSVEDVLKDADKKLNDLLQGK